MTANSDDSLSYTITTTDFSQFWYIVNFNGKFYVVNYCYRDKVLTGDLEISRSLYGAEWDLEQLVITVNYFYNYGYRYRFWKNMEDNDTIAKTSTQVDDAVVTHLQGYQTQLSNVLTNVFGLPVTMGTPTRICSREDLCYAPDDTPTFSEMVTAIGDAQIIDETADGLLDYDACNCASNTECLNHTNKHHRNASAGLDYLLTQKPENDDSIYLLTSGYEPCHVEKPDENSAVTHKYGTIAGIADIGNRVAGVCHSDSGNDYKDSLTALHEISHCLGAEVNKSAGLKPDTNHGDCVMSYDRNNDLLLAYFNSPLPEKQEKLYCSSCYTLIADYLNFY